MMSSLVVPAPSCRGWAIITRPLHGLTEILFGLIPPSRKGGCELQANRRRYFNRMASCFKTACLLIKSEHNDVVRLLIRRQQEDAAGIDGKIARRSASG